MVRSVFKDTHECACGYSTIDRGNWYRHQKICKHVKANAAATVAATEESDIVALLKQQLTAKDQQLAEREATFNRQLAAKDEQIAALLAATKEKKPRAAPRRSLPEPKRRHIAIAQAWLCANPDGKCRLQGQLEEYDIDHRTPLHKGGLDVPENMQALCPACHRRKTERDAQGIHPPVCEPAE